MVMVYVLYSSIYDSYWNDTGMNKLTKDFFKSQLYTYNNALSIQKRSFLGLIILDWKTAWKTALINQIMES